MKPLELRGLTPYGNLLHFLYDPDGFSAKVSATGDVVRVRLGADEPLFVRDPATIEQIAQRWRPAIAARDVPRPQFTITLRPGGPLRATMHGRRPSA